MSASASIQSSNQSGPNQSSNQGAVGGSGSASGNGSQVTAYESVTPYQKQPTRLTSANGNSYEIKGIPSSQSSYANNNQRGPHVFEVLSRKSIIQVI